MTRRPPSPPRPDLIRRPDGGFGWLDARLLHDGWLRDLGTDATAVLVLLAIAADRHGASYYGSGRIASALGMPVDRAQRALERLLDLGLVDLRPWRPGGREGVWQLLPVPRRDVRRATSGPVAIADLISQLRPTDAAHEAHDQC